MRRPRPGGVANTAIQIRRTAGRRSRRPVFCSEWPHSLREVARSFPLRFKATTESVIGGNRGQSRPAGLLCRSAQRSRVSPKHVCDAFKQRRLWSNSDGYRSMQTESGEPSAKPPKARHQSAIAYAPRTISTARLQAFALSFAPEPNHDDSSRRLARTAACRALVGRWWSTHSVTAL